MWRLGIRSACSPGGIEDFVEAHLSMVRGSEVDEMQMDIVWLE